MALSHRMWLTCIFSITALALYAYGVLSASHIPVEIDAVALPLDFVVGIPLAFYLMVIRPRKLSPLYVIPVIWMGYGLSDVALGSPDVGVLPILLAVLAPVEIAIAVREAQRMARVYKDAKAKNSDPMQWFYATTRYLVRKEMPARVMAAELSVWYYALLSWHKRSKIEAGEKAFSYHNAGGYMNMMLGLGLAFPVEIVAMHLLLAQWSVAAAMVVTLLSVYAAVWLVSDARARVMRPIVVGGDFVRLECGIQMEGVIPLDEIEAVALSDTEVRGIDDAEKLNFGTFYHADVWIVAKRPVEVRTLLGTKRARAIGISIDDPNAFANLLAERIGVIA